MTAKELAAILDKREYSEEITKDEEADAKAAGLVVIFGYSDDGIELRGAIDDEIGAFGGTTLHLFHEGNLPDPESEECPKCRKDNYANIKRACKVKCEWSVKGYSWYITPVCEFEPFDIMEDGEKFCRGAVIRLDDLPTLTKD